MCGHGRLSAGISIYIEFKVDLFRKFTRVCRREEGGGDRRKGREEISGYE